MPNLKVCSPLKMRSGLTGNYHAICYYSYNLPFAVMLSTHIQKEFILLKGTNYMTNYKQLIALSIIGYVCVLAIRYIKGILSSLTKIFGMIFSVNPKVYVFLDVIPEILIIILWILIVFKFLQGFTWNESLNDNIPRKFGIRFGITVLVLFLILLGVRHFENELWAIKTDYYPFDKDLLIIKTYVLSSLNLLEVAIIVIGFIKLINKKSIATNSRYAACQNRDQ